MQCLLSVNAGALSAGRGVLDIDEEELESEKQSDDEEDSEEEDLEEYEEEISARTPEPKGKIARTDDSDDEDDDDDAENEADGPDDLPMGTWGSNKQSYYSTNNLDDLSSDSEMDEDEKREMEVREVKRLQAKARQGMVDEDFGLNQDSLKLEGSAQAREARRREFETSSVQESTDDHAKIDHSKVTPLQRAEMISKIQKSSPETLALIGEYADIVEDITVVSRRLKKVKEMGGQAEMAGLCCLHHQLLLTYAANLSFYFYLRASPKYAQNPIKLAEHPVIGRLWKLKNGLSLLDNFGFTADESEAESDADEEEEEEESIEYDEDGENLDPSMSFLYKPDGLGDDDGDDEADAMSLGSLEDDELMQLYREEKESEEARRTQKVAEEAAKAIPQKRQEAKSNGKKRVAKEKAKKDVAPLANVVNQVEEDDDSFASIKERKRNSSKRVLASSDAEAFGAFGEPTQLSTSDSVDKEAKKRSLRFYTGQIDAKEARKAGGSGLGGDADIPYRDRDRSRMAVANANAKKAGNPADRRLDGDDFGEDDSRDYRDVMELNRDSQARELPEKDDDGDDYYDLVASGKRSAKRAKKDEYDDMRASQRVAPVEDLDDGEHRGINRTIEKNRGLTPHRKKENRNPRVKKRKRYEAAQKKLSSRGPIYKGGQGALQGGYTGEKTGISSNVVKSRSFA